MTSFHSSIALPSVYVSINVQLRAIAELSAFLQIVLDHESFFPSFAVADYSRSGKRISWAFHGDTEGGYTFRHDENLAALHRSASQCWDATSLFFPQHTNNPIIHLDRCAGAKISILTNVPPAQARWLSPNVGRKVARWPGDLKLFQFSQLFGRINLQVLM